MVIVNLNTNSVVVPSPEVLSIPPFPFEKKLRQYLKKCNVNPKKEGTPLDEQGIREAFFKIVLKIFAKYKNYLIQRSGEDNKKSEIFDKEGFISSSDSHIRVTEISFFFK